MYPASAAATSVAERCIRRTIALHRARVLVEGPVLRCQRFDPPASPVVELASWAGHRDAALEAAQVAREGSRAALDAALAATVSAASAMELAGIDPAWLGREDRLRRLVLADRVAAWAAARAATALADYVGPDPRDVAVGLLAQQRQLRLEVRIARKCSDDAAGRDIAAARALAGPCRPVRELWQSGEIGFRHVHAVLDRTSGADGDVIAAVLDRVAPRLAGMSAQRVAGVVTTALCALDPDGQTARTRQARRHSVGVAYRGLPDGLAQIVATHRVEDARAIMDHLDTTADRFLAHRRDCAPCAHAVPDEIGPARAAAHHALVLGGAADDHDHHTGLEPSLGADANLPTARPTTRAATRATTRVGRRSRRGELQVVIDLATLLGLAENAGLIAGAPVPAQIARELATACGSLRRIVTDPVTGHTLDYGTRTYLPRPLREFIAARDGTCRSPGCGQPAHRSQLDHITPYPHGPSDTANTHMLCKRDHDAKTEGDITITDHRADGSATWRTRDGQTGATPARPYLHHPLDTPPY